MNIADWQAEEGGEALARDAAHWFARMRGPDADAGRAAFEAWLAQRPEHLVAYNRASEIFAMGKLLAEPEERLPVPAPARRRRVFAASLATVAACVVGVGGWVASQPSGPAPDRREAAAGMTDLRTISTMNGQARVVRLADGSTVRLGDETVLEIDIGGAQRSLKLLRGRARFEVAHEQRPFIVFAGGGSVTARGTIFEVAIARSGRVDVRLLQGTVDVTLPHDAATAPPAIRKLQAGEGVSFAALPQAATTGFAPAGATAAPPAMARDFEATPVSELIALANRGAARPIRLADPSVGARRVSGVFRVDDTELLAQRLGALFGRHVDASGPHEIVLLATAPVPSEAGKRQPVRDTGQ